MKTLYVIIGHKKAKGRIHETIQGQNFKHKFRLDVRKNESEKSFNQRVERVRKALRGTIIENSYLK